MLQNAEGASTGHGILLGKRRAFVTSALPHLTKTDFSIPALTPLQVRVVTEREVKGAPWSVLPFAGDKLLVAVKSKVG